MEREERTNTAQNVDTFTSRARPAVTAENLRDALKNKRYWFSRKKILNRGFFDHWPMGDGRFVENLTNVIGTDFYGKKFDDAKSSFTFNNITDPEARAIANASTGPMREAYSLLNNNYTSRSILGKLRDMEINESVAKNRLETISGARHAAPDVDNWAIIGLNEEKITPREYFNLLKAELIVENPIIEEHRLKNRRDATFNPLLSEDTYAPPKIMDGVSLNSFQNMETIENFDRIMGTIARKARVRLVASDDLEAGNVEITKRRYYGPLRTIRNVFRNHTNSRTTGLPGAYTVKFSTENSQSEQLYMVLKSMAEASVRPYVEETQRLITSTSANNLPSIGTFNECSHAISRASACLVASDMCKMLDLDPQDARVMSTFFKVEAAQHLNSIDSQDENIMPLIADYYAESINNFAQDFGISLDTFAQYEQFDTTSAVNLGSALYSRRATPTTNILGASNFNFARNTQNTEALDYIFGYLNSRAISEPSNVPVLPTPSPKPQPGLVPTPTPTPTAEVKKKEKSFSKKVYGQDVLIKYNYEDGTFSYDINGEDCTKASFDKFEEISELIYSEIAKDAAPLGPETMRQLVSEGEHNVTEYFYIKGVPATKRAFYTQKDLVVFNGICATSDEYDFYRDYTKNQITLDADFEIDRDSVIIPPYKPEPQPIPLPSPAPQPKLEPESEEYKQAIEDLMNMAINIEPNRIESQRSVRMNKKHIIERKLKELEAARSLREFGDFGRMAQGISENPYAENFNSTETQPFEAGEAHPRNPDRKKRELIEEELKKRTISGGVAPASHSESESSEILEPIIDLENELNNLYVRPSQRNTKYGQAIMRKREEILREIERRNGRGQQDSHAADDFGDLLPRQPDRDDIAKTEASHPSKAEVNANVKSTTLDDFMNVENTDTASDVVVDNGTTAVVKKKPSKQKQEFYGPRRMGEIPTEVTKDKVKCTSTQVEKACVKFVSSIVKDKFAKSWAEGMLYNKAAAECAENSREYFDNLDNSVECHNESELYSVVSGLLDGAVDKEARKHKRDEELLDNSVYQAEREVCNELLEVANSLIREVVRFREKNLSVTGPRMTTPTFVEYVDSVGGEKKLKDYLDDKFVTPILNRGYLHIRSIENEAERQKGDE